MIKIPKDALFICPKAKGCGANLCTHRIPHVKQTYIEGGRTRSYCRAAFGRCPACELVKQGEK